MSQTPKSGRSDFQAIFPGTSSKVAFTSASAQMSGTFADGTTLVRLISSSACYVTFGANPTASTATGMYLAAGVPEYFGVTPGQKVAAIRDAADGTLYVTEGA